ncbi:putative inorganic phosphate cotransporter [Cylas formicarius]|uniref:putative inorganic phosphate cotransporter n=1 Tax=Cylas formicarius TaxID=197179 RepID=UPI0029585FD4|nr:putative inorganic phosphate cotransporter [Cylas formicarius]
MERDGASSNVKSEKTEYYTNLNKNVPTFGVRHVQIILAFLFLTIGYAMRSSLSVAIVAMTTDVSSNPDIPFYDWDNTSVILSSFFWGYIWLQVLAGYLGRLYGIKYILLTAFFINSVIFMLIPTGAEYLGSVGVMICRIGQGLSQGFLFPSAHNILGRWAPAEERTQLSTFVYSGTALGQIFASVATGYISSSSMGWPGSFYILGSTGIGWCVLWWSLGQDSPRSHPYISEEEKTYLENSLGQNKEKEVIATPWKEIFSSRPVWAIFLATIGNSWVSAMSITELPTYLDKIMNLDLKMNGIVNGVAPALYLILCFVWGIIADYVIGRGYISTVTARKMSEIIGNVGHSVCLIAISYLSRAHSYIAVAILLSTSIFSAIKTSGSQINHMDLSPRFSGVLMGIVNSPSQTIAIFSPLLVQFIVADQNDATQWRTIFIVCAAISIFTATLFFFMASATRQSWDGPIDKAIHSERVKKASVISISTM